MHVKLTTTTDFRNPAQMVQVLDAKRLLPMSERRGALLDECRHPFFLVFRPEQ